MKPTDLRGILQYIPRFRKKSFVIAADGAVVSHTNFANLLLDIAVLCSLNIRVGIGTLVYANEYRQIRAAEKKDVASILRLSQEAMSQHCLVERTEKKIEEHLDDYFLYEIDENPIACVALHHFANEQTGELAHLFVNPSHANQGISLKLVEFIENHVRDIGITRLITLSTQSFAFFTNKADFNEGNSSELPPARRASYEGQGRNPKILIKHLS